MTTEQAVAETLAEFKDSFAYGSRGDLNFKFLKRLAPHQAAQCLQDILAAIGRAMDDGDLQQLVDQVVKWQGAAYMGHGKYTYQEAPFTRLPKPLAECRVALLTSTGHFVDGDDPVPLGQEGMTQEEAVRRIGEFTRSRPQLSRIPMDTPWSRLRVRHGGYDVRGVMADPNVALPIDRLRELAQAGAFGELLSDAYSFVGATSQTVLLQSVAHEWAESWVAHGVDALVLVPV